MPFNRPTLPQLIERNAADIEGRLPGTDARLRRSNLGVIGRMLAGAVHGLYGLLEFMSRQIMPDTADAEYLDRWASIWLDVGRKPAAAAAGPVTCTGLSAVVVPTGTTLKRSDGAEFVVTVDTTIVAGTAAVPVAASVPGVASNTAAGTAMTLITPVTGLNSAALVAAGGLVGGSDIESDDALRSRLLTRIKKPPQGGSADDYVAWALSVPGVTRAWCYPLELGPNKVTVRFMRDDDPITAIPDAGEVATVQAYIDARRPVQAIAVVAAPTAVPLNFTFTSITPATAPVKAAVEAELRDLVRREAVPGGTLFLSHIREAISLAAGETNYVLSSPSADVVSTVGNITTVGTFTWP